MEDSKLKLIEATQITKEVMRSQQRAFEYRDKPNRCLANLLSEERGKPKLPSTMVTRNGQKVMEIEDKMQVFKEFLIRGLKRYRPS